MLAPPLCSWHPVQPTVLAGADGPATAPVVTADQSRLQVEGGYPWETVRTEWTFYRIVHEDAPVTHKFFKFATLLPALFVPPRLYYGLRRKLAASNWYLRFRKSFFPIPQPQHTTRARRYSS